MDPGREGVGSEGRLTGAGRGFAGSPAFLLIALAAWLAATAGLRPLLLPDEGRYASVAWEMLRGGAWVPTLDGLPFFHKPPLMYWLDIAAMQVFGVTAFAARFASLVGAWSMGAALFFALRRWRGFETARLALLVLATCPFYFLGAQYANHDMLVAGLITVAVLAFARALEGRPRPELSWIVAGWVACAGALLSKGLIGVVLPMLVIGPWLVAERRWRDLLGLLHPLGLFAFALLAGPWLVGMQLRYSGFFDYFIVEQHFRRYALTTFNNVHPFWFFIVILPALTLPWSAWLVLRARRLLATRDPTSWRLAWWVVAVIGFFSIPSSKLIGYALPALAPWCALVALAITSGPRPARAVAGVATVGAAIGLAVVLALTWKAPNSNRDAALALAARMAPGDRVAMLGDSFYDVPFYARLTAPIPIVSSWDDPDLPRHDNWRKELFDAGRFDPARAREVLWPIDRIAALACGSHPVWFVVQAGHGAPLQAVPGATRDYADSRTELWRAPARSGC